MKKRNVIILLTGLLGACAPLSKSQLKTSHNYFEAVTNYPRHYRELNVRIADLTLEAKNLESSLQDSDQVRVATIINSISKYEDSIRLPDSVAIHARYLDQYIQQYYALIPNGFSIYRALKGTTETISGIFGLGSVVSGILPNNVNGMSPTKKRKIRSHVLSSEHELLVALESLKAFINDSFLPRLEEIDQNSIGHFEELLASINHSSPPLDYYTRHNRMVTDFYQRLYHTKNLMKQLVKSIDTFMAVEKELTTSFQEKEKLAQENTHINELAGDMQRVNYLIMELNERSGK